MCFVAIIPQSLINIKENQTTVRITHHNHDTCTSTSDNLVNHIHLFSFATASDENEEFHLGQMLKQEDNVQFVVDADK